MSRPHCEKQITNPTRYPTIHPPRRHAIALGELLGDSLLLGRQDEPFDGELDKEVEVGAVHDAPGDDILLLDGARALALVEEDEAHDAEGGTDDHLRDLGDGDEHGGEPLRLLLDGHEEVVAVHDGVDGVVHGDEEEAGAGLGGVRVPAEKEDGDVVVPVEEDEVLFPCDDEEGVNELGDLREDEELYPEATGAITEANLGVLAEVLLEAARGGRLAAEWDGEPASGESLTSWCSSCGAGGGQSWPCP